MFIKLTFAESKLPVLINIDAIESITHGVRGANISIGKLTYNVIESVEIVEGMVQPWVHTPDPIQLSLDYRDKEDE
jgi:hypothetical protein